MCDLARHVCGGDLCRVSASASANSDRYSGEVPGSRRYVIPHASGYVHADLPQFRAPGTPSDEFEVV